jgi:thymidylate synthase
MVEKFKPKQQQAMISDDFQIGPNGAYEHVGNELDLQYQDLLQHILDNGVEKKDRTGTGTLSVFGRQIRHNMKDGFPLLTTKKVHFKSVVTELLWFLRGDTNIKYLVDNDCHIWDGDAYKRYVNSPEVKIPYSKEDFINKIKTDKEWEDKWGDLGPVYGKQWRKWGRKGKYVVNEDLNFSNGTFTEIDQIANSINLLKTDPDSRRNRVNAWNVGELDQMVLPPCHTDFQFYTRELSLEERYNLIEKDKHTQFVTWQRLGTDRLNEVLDKLNAPTRAISLMWNQRSVDTFLGLPFNIASYGLLLEIIAKEVNMIPDELIGNLGDVHLYLNHIEQAKEQISRTPYDLPKLIINDEFWNHEYQTIDGWISSIGIWDFKIENYQSHPAIKAPLSN